MSNAVIGALRVSLGMDSASFEKGLDGAQRTLNRFNRDMQKLSAKFTGIGQTLTLGLTVPIAAFGATLMQGAKDAAHASGQVEAALKSMGDGGGKSLEGLKKQAEDLSKTSLFDDDLILTKVTANLLTFGNVAGDVFDRAQQAALDLSARMGTDLQSSTLMLGKALNDPIKGLASLRRVGIQFTEDQQKLIKSMADAGDTAGAQAVMLGELERQFGGAAAAARAADPMAAAMLDLSRAMGTLEGQMAPLVVGLAGIVTALANVLETLTPAQAQFTMMGLAVAAAIGPMIIGIGALISSVGTIATLFAGPAVAGLVAFLAPFAPIIAAVAALTGGLGYLIYSQSDSAIAARANKQAHERLDPILRTVRESLSLAAGAAGETRKAYLDAARAAFVLGEKEIESARKSVAAARARVEASRQTEAALMRSGVGGMPGYMSGMAEQRAKEAEALLKAAEDKLIDAGVARRRGSRGRGTTFVLIDPVEAWKEEQASTALARSAGNLGDEVERTGGRSRTASEDTRNWADELVNLREQLATPIQREIKATTDQIGFLTEGLEKGKLTAYEVAQALRMIDEAMERDRFSDTIVRIDQNPTLDGPKLPETDTFGGKVMSRESIEELRAQFVSFGHSFTDAVRSGRLKDFFADIANRFVDRLVNDGLNAIFNAAGKSSGGGGWIAAIASIFTGGSGSTPGFATGGSFTVGGSGAMDSKLVQFRATPGEMVNITKGERGQRQTGTNVFDMRGAVVTQDLLNQMNQIAAQGDAQVLGAVAREKTRQDKARRYTVAMARR